LLTEKKRKYGGAGVGSKKVTQTKAKQLGPVGAGTTGERERGARRRGERGRREGFAYSKGGGEVVLLLRNEENGGKIKTWRKIPVKTKAESQRGAEDLGRRREKSAKNSPIRFGHLTVLL